MAEFSGSCSCGAVIWQARGAPTRNLICHCRDCQRGVSSAMSATIGFRPEDVQWSGPVVPFKSSALAERAFCAECGTRLTFQSERWPDEVHISAVTLSDPSAYRPDTHVCTDETVPWLVLGGATPQSDSFSAKPKEPGQ